MGVDIEKYSQVQKDDAIRDELGISRDEIIVTCIAEFNKNKNHNFYWKHGM